MADGRAHDRVPMPLMVRTPQGDRTLEAYAQKHGAEIQVQLITHGALLFRDFELGGVSSVDAFLEALAHTRMDYRPRTAVGNHVFTATEYPPKEEILLHNENAYQRDWPLKLAFYCVILAASGGQTTIADMRR